MSSGPLRFRDRADAGRQLAWRLAALAAERPVVVALPRGGVVVADEIARTLDAPLDVLVARKLGAPRQPEFGVGAIAPGGMRIVDLQAVSLMGMTDEDLERVTRKERDEMRRRDRLYRDDRPALDVDGRVVILVDDGIATGVTVRAAVMALRALGTRRVILAVGVCSRDAAAAIRPIVDDFVALIIPADLFAIGTYYDDFDQVTDDQVIDLLARSRLPPR